MENSSRHARPGCLLLAGAALFAAEASAAGKGSIAISAVVLPASLCRADMANGTRCKGSAPAPVIAPSSQTASTRARYSGQLVVKMTPMAASLDSRATVASTAERVVLTIAP